MSGNRASALHTTTRALADALTAEHVASVITRHVHDDVGAVATVVYRLRANDAELLSSRGIDADRIEQFRRMPLDRHLPLTDAMRTGRPLFFEHHAAFAKAYPNLAQSGIERVVALPMIAHGTVLGGVELIFARARRFGPADRRFLDAVMHQCAVALERARLLADAHRARLRLTYLARISAALATMPEFPDVLRATARLALGTVADWAAVDVLDDDGEPHRIAIEHAIAKGDVGAKLQWRSSREALVMGRPLRAVDSARRAYLVVPIVARARGVALGVLSLARDEQWPAFDEEDAAIAAEVAGRVAIAIESAWLGRDAFKAAWRLELKRAQASLRFMRDASLALGGPLTYESALAAVARLAVPAIADWAMVDLLDSKGRVERIAFASIERSDVDLAWDLLHRRQPRDDCDAGIARVLLSGKAELSSEVPEGVPEANELPVGSYRSIYVPLKKRERVVGAITLVVAESGRRFGASDLALAEELARRAGLAIERARARPVAAPARRPRKPRSPRVVTVTPARRARA